MKKKTPTNGGLGVADVLPLASEAAKVTARAGTC